MHNKRLAEEVLAGTPADKCCLHKDVFKSVLLGWLSDKCNSTVGEQEVEGLWAKLGIAQHQSNNGKRGRPKKLHHRILSKETVEEICGIFEETLEVTLPDSGSDKHQGTTESRSVVVKLEIEHLTKLSKKKCYSVFLAMVLWSLKNELNIGVTNEEFCLSFGQNRKTLAEYASPKSYLAEENFKALHGSITKRLKSIKIGRSFVSKV